MLILRLRVPNRFAECVTSWHKYRKHMKYFIAFFVVAFAWSCTNVTEPIDNEIPKVLENAPKKIKNIVLLVGDGMGLTQITGGMYANENKLFLEQLRNIGFIKTYSSDKLITDSAAGATAFSCGIKTYNGALAVTPDTKEPVETILERAKKKGLATGVVATASITHATPAAFYAHQLKRKQMQANVADLFVTQPDVFMGGGKNHFEVRADGRNVSEELRAVGYNIVYNVADVDPAATKVGVLMADEEPKSLLEGRDPNFLVDATKKTLEILSKDEDGFFVMIEGSQIDWGGHANDSEYITTEMIEFDKAIEEVVKFAEADGETLVIVTADHETGGYAITDGNVDDMSFTGEFNTGYHTATLIPVFAYGPGAEAFQGTYENTAIHTKMLEAFGW